MKPFQFFNIILWPQNRSQLWICTCTCTSPRSKARLLLLRLTNIFTQSLLATYLSHQDLISCMCNWCQEGDSLWFWLLGQPHSEGQKRLWSCPKNLASPVSIPNYASQWIVVFNHITARENIHVFTCYNDRCFWHGHKPSFGQYNHPKKYAHIWLPV